jgi:RNA polymerase sigma factor for flagellar operon FliA
MYTATGKMDRKLDSSYYIERYSPMVKRMAHHMMARLPASVQLTDMIQAGLIGLMDAVSRYEESQGVQFEAYASQRIRGAMIDELRANDWFPRGARKNQRRIDEANARLEQKLGRPPTEAEVAQWLGVPLEEYQDMLAEAHGFQLLFLEDFSPGEDDTDYLDRHCVSEDEDPLAILSDERFRQSLIKSIGDLPEREKLLMGLYYEQDLNFKEIAAVLGVTESRVCQLHGQAVSRLRGKLKEWKK